MKNYLISCLPNEGCGIIKDGQFLPIKNIADNPLNDFRLDELQLPDQYEAIVHSHPSGLAEPSKTDMENQIKSGAPWMIIPIKNGICQPAIWLGINSDELIGRQFIHGIFDCYSLIRDYYRIVRKITIPEFPRENNWWMKNQNLYSENFEKAGFRKLTDKETPQEHDVFLTNVRSKVLNHGGVYIGRGLILHHLSNSVSRRSPIELWRNRISVWLRYAK